MTGSEGRSRGGGEGGGGGGPSKRSLLYVESVWGGRTCILIKGREAAAHRSVLVSCFAVFAPAGVGHSVWRNPTQSTPPCVMTTKLRPLNVKLQNGVCNANLVLVIVTAVVAKCCYSAKRQRRLHPVTSCCTKWLGNTWQQRVSSGKQAPERASRAAVAFSLAVYRLSVAAPPLGHTARCLEMLARGM